MTGIIFSSFPTSFIFSVAPRLLATASHHPLPSSFFSYPIQLDDDAWLALLVSIVTVIDSGAVLQNGAVELTGALGVILHVAAVLLHKVLVWGALVVLLGLYRVVVRCGGGKGEGGQSRRGVRGAFILLFRAYEWTKTPAKGNLLPADSKGIISY